MVDAPPRSDLPPKTPAAPRRKHRSTSAFVWTAALLVIACLLVMRVLTMRQSVNAQLQASGLDADLGDESLRDLAVNIGFYLSIILAGVFVMLFFSLASVLESRLLPEFYVGHGRIRVGLLGLVAISGVMYGHLVPALLQISNPKDFWFFYLLLLPLTFAALLVFRSRILLLSGRGRTLTVSLSLAVSAASTLV